MRPPARATSARANAAAGGGTVELQLEYGGLSHNAELDSLVLIAAAAPVYQRIVSQLRALYRADEVPAIQLTDRAARMPGLADMLKARVGGEVFLLESAATARGLLSRCRDLQAGAGQISLVRKLPWDQVPVRVQLSSSSSQSLAEMIAAGQLDAALSGVAGIGRSGPPTANWEAAAAQATAAPTTTQLAPLFPKARALEVEWYQRTKIFPIHGIIVIKNAVLATHPWVAPELLRAFQASKELHLKRLAEAGPSTADDRHILENQELIGGGDPLPFGLGVNRPTIEALIAYAYSQKIIPTQIRPEEVFAPNALDL